MNSLLVINLHNECGSHDTTAGEYATAYNNALSTVRTETSYDGPIVCDLSEYGQKTHVAADAPSLIDDENVVFCAHIYPSAYDEVTGDWLSNARISTCSMTAATHAWPVSLEQTNWSALVDCANSLEWLVLGWAWNGDGSSDPTNVTEPYWGDVCGATTYSKIRHFNTVHQKLDRSGSAGGSNETKHLNAEFYTLNGATTSTSRSGF